jgi:hypothetical protein
VTASPLRVALYIVGGVCLVLGLMLAEWGVTGPAIIVFVWGVLLFIGLAFERWRYKPLRDERLGPQWSATDERFVDPETGRLVTVYFNQATGERRYIAAPKD